MSEINATEDEAKPKRKFLLTSSIESRYEKLIQR